MKKILLSLLAFTALQVNAQNSVTIVNSDTTIVAGASVNLMTTAIFPPTFSGSSNLITVNEGIPDWDVITGVTSTFVVNSALNANQIESVTVNINAEWNSDIDLYLIAPDGSQVELSTDNGGNANDYTNCIFTNNMGHLPINSVIGNVQLSGQYSPEQPLSDFTGSANGTWTLRVFDDADGDMSILLNWTITFAGGANVMSYVWSPATGLNNATIANPIASPTQTTTYTVTATDFSGEAAVTDQITITVNPASGVGINENSISNFGMFPNPSNGEVTIASTQIGGTIQIADATGRMVSSKIISTENTFIDLSENNSGVYFVSIIGTDGSSTTKKLIVRK